jgi:hypothetical protein
LGSSIDEDCGEYDLAMNLQNLLQEEHLDVLREISPRDEMYRPGHEEQYFRAGRSALRCIALAMRAVREDGDLKSPKNILDLPCGHGRIMRAMKAAFPDATFTACDINRDGVEFCADRFDARPVFSKLHGEDVDLDDQFDLIWCGSLLTHLDKDRWHGFLALFEKTLALDGLLVFTTFGGEAARRLREGEDDYRLTPELAQNLVSDFDHDGFGYTDYPGQTNSGMSLASSEWIRGQLGQLPLLTCVSHMEYAWHTGERSHQDVVVCVLGRSRPA